MVFCGSRQGCKLLLPLVELGGRPAVLEELEVFLPFLVFEGMLPLALELVCPPGEFDEQEFLALDPFPDDIEFGKGLLFSWSRTLKPRRFRR